MNISHASCFLCLVGDPGVCTFRRLEEGCKNDNSACIGVAGTHHLCLSYKHIVCVITRLQYQCLDDSEDLGRTFPDWPTTLPNWEFMAKYNMLHYT